MVVSRLRSEVRKQLGENEHEADWIISHVTGMSQADFVLHPREIADEEMRQIEDIITRRNSGEPLQYILGHTEFMGMTFKVNDLVLIPRQDTETLVENIVSKIGKKKLKVLDIGTGSGCIGISIAKLCKNTEVTLLDYSDSILAVAKENADLNGVNVKTLHCDILEAVPEGQYDVIVSNPPYIETDTIFSLDNIVSSYEPVEALDGGFDGLMFYRRIAEEVAKDILNENGIIAFEIGYNQGEEVSDILREEDFSNVRVIKDSCDNDRVVMARFKPSLFSSLTD
ncbi:MAG: peptide chain release factor N(5)-glutamine methyltransferase [Oscillospiraceae bacterium]|nr:peptide chain release factor N(5)-glutamine methyltransferase [Oscillospiraceae bacterium]